MQSLSFIFKYRLLTKLLCNVNRRYYNIFSIIKSYNLLLLNNIKMEQLPTISQLKLHNVKALKY